MRWSIVRTVFLKELREMLRDRRSLIIMFGVPLVLYPMLMLGIAGLAQSKQKEMQEESARVVVVNAADAPRLVELIEQKESGLEKATPAGEPQQALREEKVQAILTVPQGAQREALEGRPVTFDVKVDRSRRSTPFVEGKVEKVLRQYEKWVVEQRLQSRGVPTAVLEGFKTQTTDIATGEQRFGNLMAGILPLFLLITGMLGAFFPALNVTTTEREHGTLETLLVSPAGRGELLIAKGALVLLAGLVTAGLNMLSMSMVMWRAFSMIGGKLGESLQISPGALALAYVAAVPTLIFFSAIVLVVGLLARTYREASSMATPVMLLPTISMLVGLVQPKPTPGILMTPIANTTVIIHEVLVGKATVGAFAAAFAASCLYAALLVSAAARLFNNEQLVNPAWEPLSIKGLGRRGGRVRRRLPGVDEVVALWAVTILLSFYVTPSVGHWSLMAMLAVVELGLITAPAAGLAWLARWNWRETFSWRPAKASEYVGAALVGLGLIPWASFLFVMQNRVWSAEPEYFRMNTRVLAEAVAAHPWVVPIVVGALAGFCEEFLYRGPIQRALLRKVPPAAALLIGAAMFSAAHLDLHGFPVRMLLGLALGYVAWRGGSIFPAMLMHGIYDAAQVGYLAYQVRAEGVAAVVEKSGHPEPLTVTTFILLAIGAAFVAGGYLLMRRAWETRLAESADRDESALPVAAGPRVV